MFVSIACDLSNEDHIRDVYGILTQYGCKRVLKDVFESASMSSSSLSRLKRDIDRATDFYDAIRIYQYPVDGTLVITALKDKKWRKLVLKSPTESNTLSAESNTFSAEFKTHPAGPGSS